MLGDSAKHLEAKVLSWARQGSSSSFVLNHALSDSSKRLTDCSHPQGWVICRTIVICSADILISPTKGRHNGNSWQGLAEMSGKVTSFFPRARARSGRHLLIHARDRDFAQRANRGQRLPDVRVIGGSRHGLTKGSREIQPALSLSSFFGICVFRNTLAPRLGATLAPSGGNTKFWQ